MKTNQVNFKAGTLIELSFATIREGQEQTVFSDYFPKVMPVVMAMGGVPLGSFSIHQHNSKMDSPKMGALFQWPSIEAFNQLHDNADFLAIKSIRDDAMQYFSNGHFFEVREDCCVTFTEGQHYLLQSGQEELLSAEALLTLYPIQSVSTTPFQPNSLSIIAKKATSSLIKSNAQFFEFSLNIK